MENDGVHCWLGRVRFGSRFRIGGCLASRTNAGILAQLRLACNALRVDVARGVLGARALPGRLTTFGGRDEADVFCRERGFPGGGLDFVPGEECRIVFALSLSCFVGSSAAGSLVSALCAAELART